MNSKENIVEIISVDAQVLRDGRFSIQELLPQNIEKVLSWHRPDYWHIPTHADDYTKIQKNTQNILVKTTNGEYFFVAGLACENNYTSFIYEEGEVFAELSGTLPGEEEDGIDVVALGSGEKVFEVIGDVFECLSDKMGSFCLRDEKKRPNFMNYFGWCTWDAFYHKVDAEKMEEGLKSFEKIGLLPGFVILDDGALSTEVDFLNSFEVSKEKFPNGLKSFVDKVKEKYGVKEFGLWHAFEGYWAGLNPEGELAKKYGVVHNKGDIRPWIPDEPLYDLYLVSPEKVEAFFDDWYKHLSDEGVNFVKVDGQSAMELFTKGVLGRTSTMAKFQHAMQDGVENNFGEANVISCMCNGSDVYYNLKSGNVWRNSQDYFPKADDNMQKQHVYYNIYNAILSSNFAWPDWDMFQTGHAHSEYHAIARAMSGGPVYVCDCPGEQNPEIISKLMFADGSMPVFDRPALPTEDTIMTDVFSGEGLAKITNVKKCGENIIGQIGLFNCDVTGKNKVSGVIRANDIPEMVSWSKEYGSKKKMFAVYDVQKDVVHELKLGEELKVELSGLSAATYVVAPMKNGEAVLGVKGKYAMAACVEERGGNVAAVEGELFVYRK